MEHDQNFTGTINRTAAESMIAWSSEPSPLRQRPNIVMIVLDDVGYSDFGCYGSDIETPALDSLATDWLRYANFHVTPLCSPTRTCLLTGRNHHSVGMGGLLRWSTAFPTPGDSFPARRPTWPRCCVHTDTRPSRRANGTWGRSTRIARPAPTTTGRYNGVSTASTAFSRARRTSGIRN